MADKPILFSGPMVRTLLAGTKTQTRRIIRPQPQLAPHHEPVKVERRGPRNWVWMVCTDRPAYQFATGDWKAPYAVGDRLYVREHWRTVPGVDDVAPRDLVPHLMPLHYVADGTATSSLKMLAAMGGKFRQGMHMPRWASRITLTVTDVRVERLQQISASDAQAEGCGWRDTGRSDDNDLLVGDPVPAYSRLWETINGAGSWEANPWVAAYTFTVHLGNIDEMERANA